MWDLPPLGGLSAFLVKWACCFLHASESFSVVLWKRKAFPECEIRCVFWASLHGAEQRALSRVPGAEPKGAGNDTGNSQMKDTAGALLCVEWACEASRRNVTYRLRLGISSFSVHPIKFIVQVTVFFFFFFLLCGWGWDLQKESQNPGKMSTWDIAVSRSSHRKRCWWLRNMTWSPI